MVYTFLLHLCGRKELYGDRKDRLWHGQGQGLLFHNENIHIHCPLKCYGRQPVEKVITREAVLVFKSSVLNLKADVLLFFNFGSAEKRALKLKHGRRSCSGGMFAVIKPILSLLMIDGDVRPVFFAQRLFQCC